MAVRTRVGGTAGAQRATTREHRASAEEAAAVAASATVAERLPAVEQRDQQHEEDQAGAEARGTTVADHRSPSPALPLFGPRFRRGTRAAHTGSGSSGASRRFGLSSARLTGSAGSGSAPGPGSITTSGTGTMVPHAGHSP